MSNRHRIRSGPNAPAVAFTLAALLALGTGACKSSGVNVDEDELIEIGPSGGTFETPDGAVMLVVPPGAVDDPVEITATPLPAAAPPGVLPGTVWQLGPAGTRFAEPAELTIRYDPSQHTGDPAALRLVDVLEQAGELDVLEHVRHDPAAGTVTGLVRHFSQKAVAHCPQCFTIELDAEYLGAGQGVELSWELPTWSWIQIYRAVLRQCEAGETSGEYGPYTCVSSPSQALTPPHECLAPELAPDGTPCRYEEHIRAAGAWGEVRDGSLGSRGAIIWYAARGGLDEDPFRSWSWPPVQVTYFGAADPPDTPTDFRAVALGETSIRADWQPTPTASHYELGILEDGAWDDGTLPFSDFTYTWEGLDPSTAYQFRIRSVNEYGASGYAFANATTGDVVPPGCEDFRLRLDFDPVPVARGGSDVLPVWVDREPGFTETVQLMVVAGSGGTQAHEVLSSAEFAPSIVQDGQPSSTLQFLVRPDLTVGQSYELQIAGGSPHLEVDPEWCRIPITFEVVQ